MDLFMPVSLLCLTRMLMACSTLRHSDSLPEVVFIHPDSDEMQFLEENL